MDTGKGVSKKAVSVRLLAKAPLPFPLLVSC